MYIITVQGHIDLFPYTLPYIDYCEKKKDILMFMYYI